MSHVWREVVVREKGPEQLPPPHLATQGPWPMGVWAVGLPMCGTLPVTLAGIPWA